MNFSSDNAWGAHPAVLAALADCNDGAAMAYGADPVTARAEAVYREALNAPEAVVRFVATGTAANALALGSKLTVIDISLPRLRELEHRYGGALETRTSSRYTIAEELLTADLVIGSELIPGAAAPKLVTDEMVAAMKPGSVLVDIAIDQGGCFEGSHPTTHDDPTFPVHDSIYYCVANMPGAVPETATRALTNATLPYVSAIAGKGWERAAAEDGALAKGLNVQGGRITLDAVAQAHGIDS